MSIPRIAHFAATTWLPYKMRWGTFNPGIGSNSPEIRSRCTLYRVQPEICRLPRPADFYASDSWSKVFSDVQGCAPVTYDSTSFAWVLYVDIAHACNAPGRLGAGTRGVMMMPRQDMDGLIGARYIDDCGVEYRFPPSRYIGGAGHELGHAFGLLHPPGCDAGLQTCDQNALMWAGYFMYPKLIRTSGPKKSSFSSVRHFSFQRFPLRSPKSPTS